MGDGEYGPETEAAVAWVQEFHDIGADGRFGPLTYRAVVTYQDYDT